MKNPNKYPVNKSEAEWREQLDDKRYHILREKGTEFPRTGEYNLHFENGTYNCGACHTPLFKSDQKFESNCGWPSFDDALEGAIEFVNDTTHGMIRTEVRSKHGDSHLGHLFPDGPADKGGMRYCMNSASLRFIHRDQLESEGYAEYLSLFTSDSSPDGPTGTK